ncbi:MAG: hypothetical protein AB2689_03330 [Candidatus Thiodiazotropha taylori]
MEQKVFQDLVNSIRSEYEQMDYMLGWRFLTSPKSTVSRKTHSVFITLNPGGSTISHEAQQESCEEGSSYLVEKWGSNAPGNAPLQRQIQSLFNNLDWNFEKVLSGQFVPFRSPSWAELPHRQSALKFGYQIWSKLLDVVQPSTVVVMSKSELRKPIRSILGTPQSSTNVGVGWGNITAGLDIYPNCRLVSLPHLSRFQIIDRSASQVGLRELFPRWGQQEN